MNFTILIKIRIKLVKILRESELRLNPSLPFQIKICTDLLKLCINSLFLLLFMSVINFSLILRVLLIQTINSFVLMLMGPIMLFWLLDIIWIRILQRVIFCLKILGVLVGVIMDTSNLGSIMLIIQRDHVIYCNMGGKLYHQNCDFK